VLHYTYFSFPPAAVEDILIWNAETGDFKFTYIHLSDDDLIREIARLEYSLKTENIL